MQRSHKDKGIVLNLKPLKDANKLAFLLSPERGKLALNVKGAGKSLSKLAPNLDGGNIVDIVYYEGKSDIDLLLEVKLIDDLSHLKSNQTGISALLYILELVNSFIQPEMPSLSYFNEVKDLLQLLNADQSKIYPTLSYFQLYSLNVFGYEPPLDTCHICSKTLQPGQKRTAITLEGLGYICEDHLSELDNTLLIKDNILKVQKYLLKIKAEDISDISLDLGDWKLLLDIQNSWIQNVIEKKIYAYDMLKLNE